MSDDLDEMTWYAVRCVFRSGWPPRLAGRSYEERITLWRARSFDEAIDRAQTEAEEYAEVISDSPDKRLRLAQAYRIDGEPGDGAEIFSLIRVSSLKPKAYLRRFFTTGKERERTV